MLIKAGKITIEQYEESVRLLKTTKKRQGAILVELGYITAKDLFWGVQYQVKEIIYSLFPLDIAEYKFLEGEIPANEVITLKMSMDNIIYEGVKRVSNLNKMKNELPDMNSIPQLSTDPASLFQDIEFSARDKTMLPIIDGEKTIEELLESPSAGSEDLFSKVNLRSSMLTKQTEEKIEDVRKKSPLFAYIVPALFVTVSLAFLIGYFFWRDTSHNLVAKKAEVENQKQVLGQKNNQMVESQSQVSVSPDKPVAVALNEEKEGKKEKKIEGKTLQSKTTQQTKQLQPLQKTMQNRQATKPSKPVFTVLAGIFQNETNAKNLRKMLHEKGYDASILTSKSKNGGTLFKVCIGQFKDRKKAEDIATKIKNKESMQALVTVK
jgi:cell division septation protein DedD